MLSSIQNNNTQIQMKCRGYEKFLHRLPYFISLHIITDNNTHKHVSMYLTPQTFSLSVEYLTKLMTYLRIIAVNKKIVAVGFLPSERSVICSQHDSLRSFGTVDSFSQLTPTFRYRVLSNTTRP